MVDPSFYSLEAMKRSTPKKPPFVKASGVTGDGGDAVGRVRLYARLVDNEGRLIRGNETATWHINDARISEVATAIDRLLFGQDS
jgi:hypothetical protein